MKRLADAARRLAFCVALLVLTLSACSPTFPSRAPDAPGPTSLAVASTVPTATPLSSPSILCEQPQVLEGVSYATPTCEAALKVALAALPSGRLPVKSLIFAYGFFCGPGRFCSLASPPLAHVIATYTNGGRVVVNLRGEEDGAVTVMGVEPFPTIQPSPGASE